MVSICVSVTRDAEHLVAAAGHLYVFSVEPEREVVGNTAGRGSPPLFWGLRLQLRDGQGLCPRKLIPPERKHLMPSWMWARG